MKHFYLTLLIIVTSFSLQAASNEDEACLTPQKKVMKLVLAAKNERDKIVKKLLSNYKNNNVSPNGSIKLLKENIFSL